LVAEEAPCYPLSEIYRCLYRTESTSHCAQTCSGDASVQGGATIVQNASCLQKPNTWSYFFSCVSLFFECHISASV